MTNYRFISFKGRVLIIASSAWLSHTSLHSLSLSVGSCQRLKKERKKFFTLHRHIFRRILSIYLFIFKFSLSSLCLQDWKPRSVRLRARASERVCVFGRARVRLRVRALTRAGGLAVP